MIAATLALEQPLFQLKPLPVLILLGRIVTTPIGCLQLTAGISYRIRSKKNQLPAVGLLGAHKIPPADIPVPKLAPVPIRHLLTAEQIVQGQLRKRIPTHRVPSTAAGLLGVPKIPPADIPAPKLAPVPIRHLLTAEQIVQGQLRKRILTQPASPTSLPSLSHRILYPMAVQLPCPTLAVTDTTVT